MRRSGYSQGPPTQAETVLIFLGVKGLKILYGFGLFKKNSCQMTPRQIKMQIEKSKIEEVMPSGRAFCPFDF